MDPDGLVGISGTSRPLNRWALARVPGEEPQRCARSQSSQSSLQLDPFLACKEGLVGLRGQEQRSTGIYPPGLSFVFQS